MGRQDRVRRLEGAILSQNIRRAAERLAPIYQENGWIWVYAENGVPTAAEIEATIEHLLASAVSGVQAHRRNGEPFEGYTSGTGRLEVQASSFDGEYENVVYELKLDLGEL